MAGYNSLHPAGFLETLDKCSGPILYQSSPSRESYAPTLNDFMEKYVTGDYTDRSFLQTAETLKRFSRSWEKIPNEIKEEFLSLLLKSNSDLGKTLLMNLKKNKNDGKNLETILCECKSSKDAVNKVNTFLSEAKKENESLKSVKCVTDKHNITKFDLMFYVALSLILGFIFCMFLQK